MYKIKEIDVNKLKDYNAILINSYDEWIKIQKYLFSIGFTWSTGITQLYGAYDNVLVILNHGEHGEKYICWRYNEYYLEYNIIKALVIIRKEKLKKLMYE